MRGQYGHWSRAQLLELEVLKAYRTYYKQFDKTYHVQLQLESILHKGKALPDVSPLVDANFMAELETLVLTAGHDADLLQGSVCLDMTQGGEAFTQINGTMQTLKSNDMMMRDQAGIVCTILYGQDRRTLITPQTRRTLFVAYAPAGVPTPAIQTQLETIREHLFCFAPEATIERLEIFKGGGANG